jgi:hypothetical protein
VQIDLVKYYITLNNFTQLVDRHTKVEVPKGYRIVNARQHKKDKEVTKESEL